MSELRADPYLLTKGDPIIAVAKAKNIKGWADLYSDDSLSYAVIETEPDPIPPPLRGS